MTQSIPWKHITCGAVGMGISTRGVLRYLFEQGVERVSLRAAAPWQEEAELPAFREIRRTVGREYLSHIDEDILFLSPSVRRDQPPLLQAVAHGTRLCSDAELFFESYRGTTFCITGSDGKSTTTSIAERLLHTGPFRHVHAGGNIGTALSPLIRESEPEDACATELSSFQLMYMHPHVRRALITGITENHLNWHRDMEEYTEAKGHIYTHAEESIVNIDDPLCCALARPLHPYAIYSMTESEAALSRRRACIALHLSDDHICIDGKKVLPLADIAVHGRHNIQNFMAALSLTHGFYEPEAVRDIAREFKRLPHRAECVGVIRGVKYVDSSIDSSPARTVTTLAGCASPPILILCGRSKNVGTDALTEALTRTVKAIVCAGEFGAQMYDILTHDRRFADGGIPVRYTDTMEAAVALAARIADEGDTVLLSPGATSFDAYHSFDERGRAFAAAVEALKT